MIPTPEAPRSDASRPVFLQQVLAVMTAIAMILSARVLLLLSSLGAFVLAWLALTAPDMGKIAVLVVYVAGVVLPIAYLYLQGGTHGRADGS
jgi:hypothetical protein